MDSGNLSATVHKAGLTAAQVETIGVVERTFSVISLISCVFIFVSFWWFPTFRKPINRLIIWASVGNVVATVSTMISTSGLAAGQNSALCQTQAFLIQFVLPADSFWSLAMAANVYLTFFRGYDSHDLRKLERRYAVLCYGLPLLVAIVYLVLDFVQSDKIYGPAVIWCWVSPKREWMRIAFFYGPVWVSIVVTIALYSLTAREIINRRRELHALSNQNQESTDVELGPSKSFFKNPFSQTTEPIRKVTHIEVTTEQLYRTTSNKTVDTESTFNAGSVSSSSGSHGKPHEIIVPARIARDGSGYHHSGTFLEDEPPTPLHKFSTTVTAAGTPTDRNDKQDSMRNLAHLSVSPYQAPQRDASADFAPVRPTLTQQASISTRRQRKENYRRNNAAWSYAKVALLFFVALFIVWVPSTVNRIYSMVHPESPSYSLSIAAAAVLPTQGFWNAMVYAVTSWTQCKVAASQIADSSLVKSLTCAVARRRSRAARSGTPTNSLLPSARRPANIPDSFPRLWKQFSLQEALDLDPKNDEPHVAGSAENKGTPAPSRPVTGQGLPSRQGSL